MESTENFKEEDKPILKDLKFRWVGLGVQKTSAWWNLVKKYVFEIQT